MVPSINSWRGVDTAGSPSPDEIYQPIVTAYGQIGHTSEKLPNNGDRFINPAMHSAVYAVPGGTSCYAIIDLAGDGSPELIIARKYPPGGNGSVTSGSMATYRIYDLYGFTAEQNSQGKPTDGCVTVPEPMMIQILRAIRPGCAIVIDTPSGVLKH